MGVEKVRIRHACNHDPNIFKNGQVIVGYMSIERAGLPPFFDVGMEPPAIKPRILTSTEREVVQPCKRRNYLT